jgi:hypothetical protein
MPFPGALVGGRSRCRSKRRFGERPAAQSVNEHRIGLRACLAIDENHARTFRGEVLVPPGEQCLEYWLKITTSVGQYLFVPAGTFTVAATLEQPGFHQRVEPARQHVGATLRVGRKGWLRLWSGLGVPR